MNKKALNIILRLSLGCLMVFLGLGMLILNIDTQGNGYLTILGMFIFCCGYILTDIGTETIDPKKKEQNG